MRFGGNTIRGSNPRSSARRKALPRSREGPFSIFVGSRVAVGVRPRPTEPSPCGHWRPSSGGLRGSSVAWVGLNGAGESTLIKLLCRFYDPCRGSILWDGVDIRDVPRPSCAPAWACCSRTT
ncbi:ATP-binding cassette domain-containing protein [Nonomuraea sp. NPDC005983]|uniref:ATP-binding cassette domain-containing protein n=1 Tax=Nonomuraea sp. NPDC005983 TaxID=3155595 RepID=UPI00339F1B23